MKTCKAICPNDCPCACGLLLTMEDNKIIKIQGDPEHPIFDGGICYKMRKNYLSLYDEKRITSPLKRIGKKGEGKFKEISWEEAIEEITNHWKNDLDQYGPDSIVGISSSGTMGLLQKNIVDALFHKIGARQVEMTLCSGAKQAAYKSMTQGKGAMCPSLLKDSDYVLVWSCMLEATQFQSLGVLQNLRKEGKKVVCIDVFTKENEKYCDESILIKPGSDGALALGMMHVLVKEGYSDEEYLKSHTIGYEDFKKSLDAYTPAWAEEKTGISEKVIVRLAREFGQVKKPAILLGSGFSRRKNGGMNSRLIMILSAITGAWKYPGGGYVGRKSRNGDCINMEQISRPDLRTYSGKKENINTLSLTFQDPSLHAFYCAGFNPINSIHNQLGTIAGLSREDLFTVVHERVMTDTAKYADIILPATYSYEHSDCYNANLYNTFGVSYQAVIPQKEAKSNWDTIGLLARGMGYNEEIFSISVEEMIHKLLQHPMGPLLKIKDRSILETGGVLALPHMNRGELILKIVDDTLEEPLPKYIEDFKDAYPLNLVAIADKYTLNTMFGSREDIVNKRGEMKVLINPEDARERNIHSGDLVCIYNDLSSISCKAEVIDTISAGCAGISGVYESSHNGETIQLNSLHHPRLSDIGKGTTLNGNYVEIKRK